MRITLRNKDIYVGVQQVVRFAARDVPFKISYACGRSLVRLREQFDLIESERQKIIKMHQAKNDDGTPATKQGTDASGRRLNVPQFEDEQAAMDDLEALQAETVEIDVHSIELTVWTEQMQKAKCEKCGRGPIEVSSDEMAALIKLGILVDDSG